ncbi:MAG: glycerol-3-phosphate 1-O-acyltransferase PlsY [Gaiellaceae bacterium]
MRVLAWLLPIAAGYLAGSMPFGYWLVRLRFGEDVRDHGSGNIGATNVVRSFGARYGIPVLVLDVLKGLGPALAGAQLVSPLVGALAGAAAMLGHWRPLFLGFRRGGKMVATAGGAILGLAPIVAVIGIAAWLIVFLLFRYVSVASLTAALGLPAVAAGLSQPWPVIGLLIGTAFGVTILHRSNIRRLASGTEHRFELRRRRSSPAARSH